MTDRPLSQQQQRILTFIAAHFAEFGYAPSVREIGDAIGLNSTSSVVWQLNILEARGHIRRGKHNQSRALALVKESS